MQFPRNPKRAALNPPEPTRIRKSPVFNELWSMGFMLVHACCNKTQQSTRTHM